ncbi:homogentisate 1,2-dioxygenase [Mobilicoccus caccae]|uniref:Homogentisate 1,2-dioxygenase n=1 Tax=Mobilicoccus caccae TaxID=1859295 RepID=A0ABQ6IUS5_9MICO|nr:homogentisate 1,2-dioxygenase domain-containing protein [Mobilicoccus caccae]GMA41411.1 putative homogentisate 1,2-dioxygenase [Mobilicoccus caccae]
MPYYRNIGHVPPKRHTQHRDQAGHLYYEELMGEEGFFSDSSLLYHRSIPSAISESRKWPIEDLSLTPNHPLLPLHLQLHELFGAGAEKGVDAVTGRRLILGNPDVRITYAACDTISPWYRNAVGDECVYVERGNARLETVFGAFDVREGHYAMIPRATTHRWLPVAEGDEGYVEPLRLYFIEANSHIGPPKRYLSRFGQLLEHSPYCERDYTVPTAPLLAEDVGDDPDAPTEVYIKHRGNGPAGIGGTIHVIPFHPLDVVGWDGCLYPFLFHISDYEPLTGRVHQPPPTHQVWEGNNFVVCNFVPRKVDYHPLSIPVPYYHSNVDSDEVMFYTAGNYEARKGSGIDRGSISLHPGGHAHGPQPGAMEASLGAEYFDETAVMVDTFRPLDLGEGALACNDPRYQYSWTGGKPGGSTPGPEGPR